MLGSSGERCCSNRDCESGLRCNVTMARCEDPNAPILATSPTQLTFRMTVGGEAPEPQSLTVYNAGTGSLAFYVTSSLASVRVASRPMPT